MCYHWALFVGAPTDKPLSIVVAAIESLIGLPHLYLDVSFSSLEIRNSGFISFSSSCRDGL